MDQALVTADTPGRDDLSGAEIRAALEALSPGERLKLGAIADFLRGGTGLEKGDLVQEAACRALDGRRKCPRDVPFVAVLAGIMRSVASHERAKRRGTVSLTNTGETVDGIDPGAIVQSPEDDLSEKQRASIIQAIYTTLGDDPEAQLVWMGWTEDLRGAALREATGLSQDQLDYAIRRIRTKARKLYPEGALT